MKINELRSIIKDMIAEINEKKKSSKPGLWANIHARRKAGKRPLRPGEKGYPKTLDIDEDEPCVYEDDELEGEK